MKRLITSTIIIGSVLSFSMPVFAKTDKEILFRDIPWGTSCVEAEKEFQGADFFHISGEWSTTCSIDEVVYDSQIKGIDFDNNDINISSSAYTDQYFNISVAGYTPTEVEMFYAYQPIDNVPNTDESLSMLYAAQYMFEPENLYGMSEDLKNKLSGLYGDPDNSEEDRDNWMGYYYTYTFWEGANNTEVILATRENIDTEAQFQLDDGIRIIYAWKEGDNLLQVASDAISSSSGSTEASNFGSDNTDGL